MPCLSMFGLFHLAMYSKFICIVINAKISSFLRLYKILVLCRYHIFFIHPSVIGHLDCFNIVGVVSSASVNMRYLLQILFSIFLDIQPEQDCWTTYQYQFLFIYFWNLNTVFHNVVTDIRFYQNFRFLPALCKGFNFSLSSSTPIVFFNDGCSNGYEVISTLQF